MKPQRPTFRLSNPDKPKSGSYKKVTQGIAPDKRRKVEEHQERMREKDDWEIE